MKQKIKYIKKEIISKIITIEKHLNQIEKRFHELIMQRAGIFIEKYEIEMPHITRFT